jgi:hypothetical protein
MAGKHSHSSVQTISMIVWKRQSMEQRPTSGTVGRYRSDQRQIRDVMSFGTLSDPEPRRHQPAQQPPTISAADAGIAGATDLVIYLRDPVARTHVPVPRTLHRWRLFGRQTERDGGPLPHQRTRCVLRVLRPTLWAGRFLPWAAGSGST